MNDEQKNNLLAVVLIGGFAAIIYNAMTSITEGLIPTDGNAVNNPGNIKSSAITWQGKITKPGDVFESFSSMYQGFRAMLDVVRAHYSRHGQTTLNQLFRGNQNESGYTSDPEPVPTNYAQSIANALGISPEDDYGQYINNPDTAVKMLTAMTKFEQGKDFAINPVDIETAYASLES